MQGRGNSVLMGNSRVTVALCSQCKVRSATKFNFALHDRANHRPLTIFPAVPALDDRQVMIGLILDC